jgi:hypothetical protein
MWVIRSLSVAVVGNPDKGWRLAEEVSCEVIILSR